MFFTAPGNKPEISQVSYDLYQNKALAITLTREVYSQEREDLSASIQEELRVILPACTVKYECSQSWSYFAIENQRDTHTGLTYEDAGVVYAALEKLHLLKPGSPSQAAFCLAVANLNELEGRTNAVCYVEVVEPVLAHELK